MRVYVAAPWKHRAHARATAQYLRDHGQLIFSRWHDEWGTLADESIVTDNDKRLEAKKDIADVQVSDVLVVLNIELSEGKAVEQGIAIGAGIPVIVVGPRTHVFQYLDMFTMVASIEEAVAHLMALDERMHP